MTSYLRQEETVDFHIRWAWAKISRYYNTLASDRSLTRALNKLEENGLITRIQDKEDKRKMNVFLTEEGKQMRNESKRVVLEFNATLREEIGQSEFNTFLNTMEKINKHIDTQLIESQSYKSK